MSKILIDAGPSPRGWLREKLAEIILTGSMPWSIVQAEVAQLFNELREDSPPAGTCRIPLTQGKWALVDAVDFFWLSQWKWTASKLRGNRWIAVRKEEGKPVIQMHHVICPTDKLVDHANCDGLDNRRLNLRPATYSQNGANSKRKGKQAHGYKGIYLDSTPRRKRRWVASIKVNYRTQYLGRFSTSEEAARVYDAAARKHFGAFARCNFPEGG